MMEKTFTTTTLLHDSPNGNVLLEVLLGEYDHEKYKARNIINEEMKPQRFLKGTTAMKIIIYYIYIYIYYDFSVYEKGFNVREYLRLFLISVFYYEV